MVGHSFDVVIAGGGLAGSALGGVLARSGLGVLVVEKETAFRDRVRGELAWPWGHSEALRAAWVRRCARPAPVMQPRLDFSGDGQRVDSVRWEDMSGEHACSGSGMVRHKRGLGPNSCTWSSRIARGHLVLVGDAAGALDPTQGLGTSLLFRDVRTLSELLTTEGDWDRATSEFAGRRQAYYEVLRAYDQWCALLDSEVGPEADRRRELNAIAREKDPTLGGFATIEARGPDGLVPDLAARRTYFGT